ASPRLGPPRRRCVPGRRPDVVTATLDPLAGGVAVSPDKWVSAWCGYEMYALGFSVGRLVAISCWLFVAFWYLTRQDEEEDESPADSSTDAPEESADDDEPVERPVRSLAQLLAEASDRDLCDEVFSLIVEYHGGDLDVSTLREEERTVLLAYHASGIIGN